MSDKRKACFLDRDGVIIVEKNYLADPADIELIPGVIEALKKLSDDGYLLIVVTNQSGIARGYYDEAAAHAVNDGINALLRPHGTEIDAFYICPHHPEFSGKCSCRKPEPGMINQAVKDFNISHEDSFMVGDKVSDVKAAENAGITGIMVRTGHGVDQKAESDWLVADDLPAAVELYYSFISK